nr:CIC_HP1_G0027430.mRNA.1.CDS.1 [Saccharomyces cerevisiae]
MYFWTWTMWELKRVNSDDKDIKDSQFSSLQDQLSLLLTGKCDNSATLQQDGVENSRPNRVGTYM